MLQSILINYPCDGFGYEIHRCECTLKACLKVEALKQQDWRIVVHTGAA